MKTLCTILIVCFALFGCDNTNTKPTENLTNNVDTLKRLFTSVDVFKTHFNTFSEKVKSGFSVGETSISNGEINNTFSYLFNDNLSVVGSLNKQDNSIKEIMFIGSGDGTATSGADILIIAASLISTCEPNLTQTQKDKILNNLGFIDGSLLSSEAPKKAISNNISYTCTHNEVTGFNMFISKL